MKRKILLVLIAVLFLVMVGACVLLAMILSRGNDEEQAFESLSTLVAAGESAGGEEDAAIFTRDLSPLFEQNSDCVGWIYIADTAIDYPVMHTPYDPEKYLHLNFEEKYSYAGVPFLQGADRLDSDNLLIYGHNMKNGTMFHDLKKYRDYSYYATHPLIEWETANGLQVFSVFAVVRLKSDDAWYSFMDAADKAEFDEQVARMLKSSLYEIGIVPQYGQQLLTLSTCHGRSKSDRLIVVGVEL
ncbi:MAG: class B sortase [Firmicutes bacterium]|nr:class B sortase [Bacillota bacterium]